MVPENWETPLFHQKLGIVDRPKFAALQPDSEENIDKYDDYIQCNTQRHMV